MAPPIAESVSTLNETISASNTLAKASAGTQDLIGKTLSMLYNTILSPLAPIFIYLMQQLVLGWLNFKAWWDGLGKWVDENLFKPIMDFIDKYLVQPVKKAYDTIMGWIDHYIVQPFWKAMNFIVDKIEWLRKTFWDAIGAIAGLIDEYVVQPFWKAFGIIAGWVDEHVAQPFWKALSSIAKWADDNITKPFWSAVNSIRQWIKDNVETPFWDAISKLSTWIDENLVKPFKEFVDKIGTMLYNMMATLVNDVLKIPGLGDAIKSTGISNVELRSYGSGGVVPGSGAQLAVVHGGETITPAGKSGGNITINFNGYNDTQMVNKVKDILRRQGSEYNL